MALAAGVDPAVGVNPLYVTGALVGVFLLLVFAGLVAALLRGQKVAETLLRRLAARVTFMDEDRTAAVVQRLALRLREIIASPQLVRRVVLWAVANWLLDAASLWVFLRAFGGSLRVDSLLVTFCLVNILAVIPLTPGGLGIVDGAYTPLLVGFGLSAATATLGVPSYRVAQFWLPIPIGALTYLSLRVGRWRIGGPTRIGRLRDAAEEARRMPDPVFGRPSTQDVVTAGLHHAPPSGAAGPGPLSAMPPSGTRESRGSWGLPGFRGVRRRFRRRRGAQPRGLDDAGLVGAGPLDAGPLDAGPAAAAAVDAPAALDARAADDGLDGIDWIDGLDGEGIDETVASGVPGSIDGEVIAAADLGGGAPVAARRPFAGRSEADGPALP